MSLTSPCRVLIVDDSAVARRKISEVLDRLGVRHKNAQNGLEAWNRLESLASHAEQTGCPETDKLVPARFGLEAQLLIMGELVFKGLFAITNAAHIDLPFCAAIVRFRFPINQKGVQSAMQTSAIPGESLMARRFGRKG